MSKKDFELIANALALSKANIEVCRKVAAACALRNKRFQYRLFMLACGIDPRDI